MRIQEIYQEGWEGFVLNPQDNPECIWFYAAWTGMKGVCDALGIDIQMIHHQIHHALCQSNGEWPLVLKDLQQQSENMVFPKKPKEGYHSDYEPTFEEEDIEKRAQEIFHAQFKISFPNRRYNSKFGQAKWEEVKEKAREIPQKELQTTWEAWRKREEERQLKLSKDLSQWAETCKEILRVRDSLQRILETSQPNKNILLSFPNPI